MTRKFQLKPNDTVAKCPWCGNNTEFTGYSQQVCEDGCEVWVVCKCGYDPTLGKIGHRLESVMGGLDNENISFALQVWSDEIEEAPKDESPLKIERSHGRTKAGISVFYVRPAKTCFNRSRRFVGLTALQEGIKKWFGPEVRYFEVKSRIIGSNNETNALKEYWRVCDKSEIGVAAQVQEHKEYSRINK